MVRAIVLTGAPGAGKSTVLEAYSGLLDNDRVPFAAFETEQFAWGHPWLEEETAYAVVAHSRVLAARIPALRGIDLHVSTDGRDARDVAAEIRSKTLQER